MGRLTDTIIQMIQQCARGFSLEVRQPQIVEMDYDEPRDYQKAIESVVGMLFVCVYLFV